jgi:surface antigen
METANRRGTLHSLLILIAFFAQVGVPSTAFAASPYVSCVAYVQKTSPIKLRGDAWQWWDRAVQARLARGKAPEAGAVMVFQKTKMLRRGHVAVVSRVLNNREILVDHANWTRIGGRRGRIEPAVKVIDVSPGNDWSEVRVWYAPAATYGTRVYPVSGFIYKG